MNTAIIMLGSNIDACSNLELAIDKLRGCFEIVGKSNKLKTKPVGLQCSMNFMNMALKFITNKNRDDTVILFKQIEFEMGRNLSKTTTNIPIDIDLIYWNDHLIHDDYTHFEYVRNCVNEIK